MARPGMHTSSHARARRLVHPCLHAATASGRNRPRLQRAFTLIEVLLAASITAAACTVATMLIQTINQTASASSGTYAGVATARDALLCIDMLAEDAALVGYWDAGQVLLWRGDENADGQINLAEVTLVRYDAGTHDLVLQDVPVSGYQNSAVRLSQFVTLSAAQAVTQHSSVRSRRVIGGLSAFQAWCNGAAGDAQAVQVTLTIGSGGESQTLHALTMLRSRTRQVVP